ncbi:E3 ubiquitin-protein ligase TRIM39 [Amia ocellicauda]|uniref:E3 ubiquitin-protein ligase TRIM39 n=1 Tax=Amia ocellicauda TaxID=2972642 RepID=UPI003463DE2B
MASVVSVLSEDQFQCSICLDVFTDPVSTPCGHNFCQVCISKYWAACTQFQCPLCKQSFERRPNLHINTILKEITERFKGLLPSPPAVSWAGDTVPEVPCDLCPGEASKAVKSCLVCLASYCGPHLQPHQQRADLRRHTLSQPVRNILRRKCAKHHRLLDLYCRTDRTCVCAMCSETDHRKHNTVPLEREWLLKKANLGKTIADMQQMIQEKQAKAEEISRSVELSRLSAQTALNDSLQLFSLMVRSMERSQAKLIKLIEEKQKAVERRAAGFLDELEQEIGELRRRHAELAQLLHTEDHVQFVQNFPSQFLTPQGKDWSDVTVHSDLCLGAVQRVVSELEERVHTEVTKLAKADLKKVQRYEVNVTLDPRTAHPYLTLSEDYKQVALGPKRQTFSNHPERFDCAGCILGRESFTSGRHYWEVTVWSKTDWDLGVVRDSINRKGKIRASPGNGFWFMSLRNRNRYTFRTDPPTPLDLAEKPRKVGVYVDYEEGQVSFYNVEAGAHIYTFTDTFTEKLLPYFSPCTNEDGNNSAPLVISPVSHMD